MASARKRQRRSEDKPQVDEPAGPTGWEALEAKQDNKSDEKDSDLPKAKLSKHAKHRLKLEKEDLVREMEHKNRSATPTSIPEFEQLVLASPNSSFVWIRYMSFLISLGDLEKAGAVAKRALATINYREDSERMNVWIAWLNTESHYGSDESTEKVFNSALSHADTGRMYLTAIDIFEKAGKTELLEQCTQAMCRKYSESVEVWLRVIKLKLTQGEPEAAQKTLERSLLSLPKFDHVTLKSKAGMLEYKVGDAERGRSIFENLLHDFPRRLDLWSIYLDHEIMQGDQQRIRSIFERATHLQLPPKKMKFLFKRYLEYEKQHGDAASVSHVKQSAMDFVERALVSGN